MSTATVTMTPEQAQKFRAAYDARAKQLDRRGALAGAGADRFGGQWSKDELIRRVMDLDGYTIARLNLAIHVLHHADETWPDCPHCAGSAS